MDTQFQDIVRHLAQGIHPLTGEVLPPESPLNEPVVIRALYSLLNAVSTPESIADKTKKPKKTESRPANFGKPWIETDRQKVAEAFAAGQSETELSRTFERTRGGIRSELARQGLIEGHVPRAGDQP